MQFYWKRGNPTATCFGQEISVTNFVRNELPIADRPLSNKPNNDVVMTEPDDGSSPVPYMPRHFPSGVWEITQIQDHPPTDEYLYPFYLATNAWQMVDEWRLNEKGEYLEKTGHQVRDAGYGIHFPGGSTTTLGCLRVTTESDIRWLAAQVEAAFVAKQQVFIRVED